MPIAVLTNTAGNRTPIAVPANTAGNGISHYSSSYSTFPSVLDVVPSVRSDVSKKNPRSFGICSTDDGFIDIEEPSSSSIVYLNIARSLQDIARRKYPNGNMDNSIDKWATPSTKPSSKLPMCNLWHAVYTTGHAIYRSANSMQRAACM